MFAQVTVDDWPQLKSSVAFFRSYLFRGQPGATWDLKTSIERIAEQAKMPLINLPICESTILREFIRRAHLVMASPPADHEWLEWLAAIQHYGGPTRLLDFTRSLYISAFFAFEQASDDVAIWAVRRGYLEFLHDTQPNETKELRRIRYQNAAESALKGSSTRTGVLPLEPYRFNERMAIQKGVFLFPMDVTQSFAANLAASTDVDILSDDVRNAPIQSLSEFLVACGNSTSWPRIFKLILPYRIRREVLDDLDDMNIHAAALFPGIEGMARSLQRHLRYW